MNATKIDFLKGVLLTAFIALIAKLLVSLPALAIMGQLVLAILLGMLWRASVGFPTQWSTGIDFASKKLLRLGIILLGMRLNLVDIYEAGLSAFAIAVVNVLFTLVLVYALALWLKVPQKLGILTACGTAICGAAAIVAIAPQIKANEEETAVSAAIIALLGTVATLIYTCSYGILQLTSEQYGVFAGATLHEIAHVIAAAAVAGDSAVDTAVIVKLTRVALLVPVAIIIGALYQRKTAQHHAKMLNSAVVPWFILGFLAVSAFNSLGIVPASIAEKIVALAYMLIAMAMAGLGLNVALSSFRRLGASALLAGAAGSVALAILGYVLTNWLI